MATQDATGMASAARIAPWHGQAQYETALAGAGNALTALESGSPQAQDATQAAENRIAALIEMNPYEYGSHALMASYLARRGSIERAQRAATANSTFQRAQAAAESALSVNPRGVDAAYSKAFSEYRLGKLEPAIKTLEPVWDIDARFVAAGALYVELLERQGYHDRAVEALVTMKQRFPGNPDVEALTRAVEASGTAK